VNRESWHEAAECCQKLLDADNLNPLVHLYHALILERTGSAGEAEKSVRRALYLDRNSAPAHYRLGLLLQLRGDRRQAERCFANALTALEGRAGNETLPDLDAITVAQLRNAVRMRSGKEYDR
jgi:chemotaxis protein methyltransferase CheR